MAAWLSGLCCDGFTSYREEKVGTKQGLTKVSVLALIAAGLAPQAMAQSAEGAQEDSDTVIVTATRRATNILETPIAVTNVSQEQLDQLNVDNISTLNNLVPGLQIRDNSVDGQGGVDINLRGIGNSNFIETAEPNVAFNIDGVYTARPQAALQLFHDLERVEVARGPQGTLQGRNATVGSINVVTKKPQIGEFSARVATEFGSFDARGVQATLNVPVNDSFAIRANFSRYKRDSHTNLVDDSQTAVGGTVAAAPFFNPDVTTTDTPVFSTIYGSPDDTSAGSFGSEDTLAARLSTLYAPNDNFEWLVTYEYFRDQALGNPLTFDCDRADCEAHLTPEQAAIAGPDTAFLSFRGSADVQIHNVRSNISYDVGDLFNVRYLIRLH